MPLNPRDLSLFVGIFNGSSRGRFTSLEMVSPFKKLLFYRCVLNALHEIINLFGQNKALPCLPITKQQQAGLQAYLTEQGINAQVEIAMTYGNPSMQSAVKKFNVYASVRTDFRSTNSGWIAIRCFRDCRYLYSQYVQIRDSLPVHLSATSIGESL